MRIALASVLALGVVAGGVLRADAESRSAGWELHVPDRVELVAGTSGTLPLAIAVDRGRSISTDAAVIIDLAPDAAIQIKRRRLGRGDAVDPDASAPRFQIALRATTPGDFALRVRVRFWLCGSKVCRPVEARRNVAVAVAAPPPAPASPPAPTP